MKKRLLRLRDRFRHIRPRLLLLHIVISLIYPAAKAAISEYNRLLIFTDALTVIAALLVIFGVIYSFVLHGDFDISGFLFQRGMMRKGKQNFEVFMQDRKQEREEAFNYPLFLGIVYFATVIVLAYGFL